FGQLARGDPDVPVALERAELIGPHSSSGVVNLVRRMENLLPPVHDRSESRSNDLAQPGGPTSKRCSPAKSAVRAKSISSSRSISADDSALRAVANFACSAWAL